MDPFIGQIIMFAGNFAPRGWALCDGALLSIAQNSALFSILGVTYGGNGQTTFGLPDLRGRTPMSSGAGPGLTPRTLGWSGGAESVVLNSSQLPPHIHPFSVSTQAADDDAAEGMLIAKSEIYTSGGTPTVLNPTSIGPTGGSLPIATLPPVQVVNYIIATEGIFPSRP